MSKLTLQKQLATVEEALERLESLYLQYDPPYYLCWIFYSLLDLYRKKDTIYTIDVVTPSIKLFTYRNMKLHSKVNNIEKGDDPNYPNPYNEDDYIQRKVFLKWMIAEYKLQLTKQSDNGNIDIQ